MVKKNIIPLILVNLNWESFIPRLALGVNENKEHVNKVCDAFR